MSEAPAELARRKAALREAIRGRRIALDAGWTGAASRRLGDHLLALPELQGVRVVMGYMAMPGEANIDGVLQVLQARGTRVCIPAPHGRPREYDPAWLPPPEGFDAGQWGIREPAHPDWVGETRIDVVLVPGVAFDTRGGRMGHGRGFYDRMLTRLGGRVGSRIGVAFAFQVVESVPCGEHDVRMDAVAVETGVLRVGASGAPREEGKVTT